MILVGGIATAAVQVVAMTMVMFADIFPASEQVVLRTMGIVIALGIAYPFFRLVYPLRLFQEERSPFFKKQRDNSIEKLQSKLDSYEAKKKRI